MREKVLQEIRRNNMFAIGDTVIVAVSGGADSVTLLHILRSLQEYRLRLVVAHLNHLLRGDESDGDEAFVTALAADYGLPIVAVREDVSEFSRQHRLSLEEAGRTCRYRFFNDVATAQGATIVALAHHADDQAETVLMRLLRGSAGTGLCGMAPRTSDGRYVRPLLGVTRREIEEYAQENAISYRVDGSNSDTAFLRNRIRHELLPFLETFNPSVRQRLAATAAALAADEQVLESLVDGTFSRLATFLDGKVNLPVSTLAAEPPALRARVYRRSISRVKGDLKRVGSRHIGDIDLLLASPKPHLRLVLPDGIQVDKSYDTISFKRAHGADEEIGETAIEAPGTYRFTDYVITVSAGDGAVSSGSGPCRAHFDLDAAPFPWRLRTFRHGDRFVPWGMDGHKKLKDLFIDRKVPRETRRRIPLLFCGDSLMWVCGIRRSSAAPVNESTKSVVAVHLELVETLNSL